MSILQVSYLQENNPTGGIVVLVVISVAVIAIVVANALKHGIKLSGGSLRSTGARRFSRWAIRRIALGYGLDREESALLERIFRKNGVTDPETTMENPPVLDKCFKKAFADIDAHADTESLADYEKALLFSIRASVEAKGHTSAKTISTRMLHDGVAANLTSPKGDSFPVRIISAKGDTLKVESPKNAVGTPLRLSRGAKVALSFYAKSSQGYRFETRVLGMVESPKGPILELAHQDHIAALPGRRHKRTEVQLSAFFSSVRIEQRVVGRKVEKKTVIDDKRSLGMILDLSVGGAALKSAIPIHTGEYIKIEFDEGQEKTHAALARIVRTNKAGAVGGIMHLQFVKVPRRTANAIQAIVYGYVSD